MSEYVQVRSLGIVFVDACVICKSIFVCSGFVDVCEGMYINVFCGWVCTRLVRMLCVAVSMVESKWCTRVVQVVMLKVCECACVLCICVRVILCVCVCVVICISLCVCFPVFFVPAMCLWCLCGCVYLHVRAYGKMLY